MTMWTSQWPTKEQLPISSSRTVESTPVPNPITLLNSFPAMWTNCLVVSCPNKRASHDKHKDNTDYTNGHQSRERQGRLLKPRRNHRHTERMSKTKVYPTTVKTRNWRNCRLNKALFISTSILQHGLNITLVLGE